MNSGMLMYPVAIMMISDESDKEFMEQLYCKYYKMMFRMAWSLSASWQDTEDIVADSIVSLIGKISVLRQLDCSVLEGYIISVVKNTAFLHWRKLKGRKEVRLDDEIIAPYMENDVQPEGNLLNECTIRELTYCIGKLREEDQTLLRMRYFEKCSNREIAAAFGITESHVRTKLTRIRNRLHKMLSEAEDGEKDKTR